MTLISASDTTSVALHDFHVQAVETLEKLIRQGQTNPAITKTVLTAMNSITAGLQAAEENLAVLRILNVLSKVTSEAINATNFIERRALRSSVAEEIRDLLQADVVVLYEVPEGKELRTRSLPGLAGEIYYPDLMVNRLHATATVHVFWKQDSPTYILDTQSNPILTSPPTEGESPSLRFTIREQIRSTIVLPLFFNTSAVGLAFINYRTPQEFSEFHTRQVAQLAQHLPLAMHSIRASRRATEYRQKHNELLQYIREITEYMDNPARVQFLVIKAAVELVEAPRGSLVLWDKNSPNGHIVTCYHNGSNEPSRSNSLLDKHTAMQQEIMAGNTKRIDDVANSPELTAHERALFQKEGIRSLMIVPVRDDANSVIATIGIDETQYIRHFDDHEVSLCQFLANHVAIVFKHIDALAETRDVLAVQQKALDAAENRSDPEAAFKIIVDEGLRLIDADYGQLLRISSSGQYLQIEYSTDPEEKGRQVSFENSVTGMAAKLHKAILIGNISEDKQYGHLYQNILRNPANSELAMPLFDPTTQKVIGVLNAESSRHYAFTEKHKRIWEKLAESIAKVVGLTETIAEKNALLSLNHVARRVVDPAGTNIDELLEEIFQSAKELANAEIGQMMLLNEDNRLVNRYSTEDDVGQELDLHNSISGIAVLQGKTVNVNSLELDEHPTYGPYKVLHRWFNLNKQMKSELAVPMRFGEQIIGVINLESEREYSFTELHQGLVETLANQAAILIQQAQLIDKEKALNQKRLEAEVVLARTRDIDNVMHRFNNPLGAARQYALLLQEELNEPQINLEQLRSDVQKTIDQIERATANVRERTLDPRSVAAKELDVNVQIQKAVNAWKQKWGEQMKQVHFDDSAVQLDLPSVRCGDKLHEVILDLLDNAMESGLSGPPSAIMIRSRSVEDWVEIEVEDTGQGIPVHLRTRIFERHFSTKKQAKDIVRGLGLPWDRQYISDYGGETDILKSEPNVGTTMVVRLQKWRNGVTTG